MDFLVLTKTGGILGPFATILGFIINYIYKGLELIGIPNVALAIILFTLLVNLILLPLTIKQQKSSKMMSVMNPEIQKIQAKYKGKKDEESMRLMQAETQAVYAKYGASPTGGCIYMVIQLPILFALYQVIYRIPAYITSVNDLYMQIAEPISKVAGSGEIMQGMITALKLRVPGFDPTSTASIVDFLSSLKTVSWGLGGQTGETLASAFANSPDVLQAMQTYGPQIFKVNSIFGILNMSDLPTTNGWFPGILIPILAGVTQYASVKFSMASQPQQSDDNSQMANSMKSMNTIMPIFSIVMCFSFQIGIGVYWIVNAVVRTVFMVIANKSIDKKGLDNIIAESREKARIKAEKRGDKPSKLQEYATMSAKGYQQPVKRKSISEIANISTITEAEKKQMKQQSESKSVKSDAVEAKDTPLGKEKDVSEEPKKASRFFGKKEEEPQNIAAIAHMLDNNRR